MCLLQWINDPATLHRDEGRKSEQEKYRSISALHPRFAILNTGDLLLQ